MANLLLIDPDQLHVEMLASFLLLRRPDHQIWIAGTGDEAAGVLYHQKIDLVIMELVLEGIDGLELLAQIARDRPQIPTIVTTAALPDFATATHALGATTFLSKPIREDELMLEIERLLRLHLSQPLLGLNVAGLLQMIAGQPDDCMATLLSVTEKARIYFRGGNAVHATIRELSGPEAIYAMMPWEPHHFHTSPLPETVPHTITDSLTGLLMEAAQRLDEAQAPNA